MPHYDIRIDNIPEDLPRDVLVEHLGYAVRNLLRDRRFDERGVTVKPLGVGGTITYDLREPLNAYRPTIPPQWSTSTNRTHPFEGPVVNDDLPEPLYSEASVDDDGVISTVEVFALDGDSLNQVFSAIGQDFPKLSELFAAKREDAIDREVRRILKDGPPAEGDWALPNDDNVGDDL